MKILIIEDNQKLAQTLKRGLERKGFVADTAITGEGGLDMASEGVCDVIVLDWMLPDMEGVKVCQVLREEEKINTPIIMLTAKNFVDDKVRGLESGADDYLTKPFEFKELVARIKALGRRREKEVVTKIKIGCLEIDAGKMEVTRDGQKIRLSKTEMALLMFLAKNQGKVVSKEQIINHVWPYDSDVLPNTVEAYIRLLRQKLEKPFKNKPKLIETVRGFGYRLKNV